MIATIAPPAPKATTHKFTVIHPARCFTTAGVDASLTQKEYKEGNAALLRDLDNFGIFSCGRESIKNWLELAKPGEIRTLSRGHIVVVLVCNENCP